MAAGPSHSVAVPGNTVLSAFEVESEARERRPALPYASLGGANAKGSAVVGSGGIAQGFPGIDIVQQASAGTGEYSGTGNGLEPPDQALCVGNGYVVEGVNDALRIFDARGIPLTPPILMNQFYKELPFTTFGATSFLADPKCIYDADTRRFFMTMLQADMPVFGVFGRAHNLLAVSKTSDPTEEWYLYRFDVTNDGLMGTPLHPTCPCIGDQPLIGADKYGFYISTNEYSDLEIVPVEPPPLTKEPLARLYTLPDFRNGQAQLYAFPKAKLVKGESMPFVELDTADIAVPSTAELGSIWSSLQPAFQPPGDGTSLPANGVEYFLSRTPKVDYSTAPSSEIEVWAWTNTASLNSAEPKLELQHTTLKTSDTYTFPDSASQKDGPTPLGDGCLPDPCELEKLNANDDRMNQVMLTNGHLWSALNTLLPPINENGEGQEIDPRTGIMYFDVKPAIVDGKLTASMVRDGYVNVPRQSVLFPSIAASPKGPVVMSFSLSGVDHYPSAAWARLDGMAKGEAPLVHISAAGVAPEDGFTGYCVQGILSNLAGQCTEGKSRWGDYSASVVDEHGCIWSGVEYISGLRRLAGAGNWSTFVTRIATEGCFQPALTPVEKQLGVGPNIAPCLPLFAGEAGTDDYTLTGLFTGQHPQLDIIKGDIELAPDGKSITTTLTLKNLTKDLAFPGGQGNEYYMVWSYDDVQYFSHVSVDSLGTVTYSDGQIDGNFYSDRTDGPADTGSFNEGPNGTVVVNVPLDQIGKVKHGDVLQQPVGETRELIGAAGTGSLQPVDGAGPEYDFQVGQTCNPSKAAKATKVRGTKEVQGRPLPATGLSDTRSAVIGLALVTAAAITGRRLRRAA